MIHTVFELNKAIEGVDMERGPYWSDYEFSLFRRYESNDINDCLRYIEETIKDYKDRGESIELIILQVYKSKL